MILVQHLTYTYDEGKIIHFPDFAVNTGDQCLLLGESGRGKTTLLHLLGGLIKSQQGKIEIDGTDITGLSETALDKFRGRHIGLVFQKNHLISALTMKKNLLMVPFLAGVPQDEQRVMEVLQQLDVAKIVNATTDQISQGQAQRVAIARAVLNRPSVILADEPTSALDDRNCERVIDLLLGVARQNRSTLLIATHDKRLKSKIQQQVVL